MCLFIRLTTLGVTATLLLCGCHKHHVLETERASLENQRRLIQEQIDAYDEKIRGLGRLGNTFSPVPKPPVEANPQIEIATAAAREKLQLWTGHEDRLKKLSIKADALEAKYLR